MADVDNQNQTIDELMGELEESRSDEQHLQRYTSRIESELAAAQRRLSLLEASQPDVVLAERASEEEVAQQEAESELEDHTLRLRSKLAALEADLEQVTYLYLSNSQLTDVPKGLEKLNQLTRVDLYNNPDITKAQIAGLQKAVPNCEIRHDATK